MQGFEGQGGKFKLYTTFDREPMETGSCLLNVTVLQVRWREQGGTVQGGHRRRPGR